MERLPLLVTPPTEAALLPGERRTIALTLPRMQTAARLAAREGRELSVLCFEPPSPHHALDDAQEPPLDALLPIGTRCALLELRDHTLVLRAKERLLVHGSAPAGCGHTHDDAFADGTHAEIEPLVESDAASVGASIAALRARIEQLRIGRVRETTDPSRTLDRLALLLAPPPFIRASLLCEPDLARRAAQLEAHLRELAAPGSSFREADEALPYRSLDEYLEELVTRIAARAKSEATEHLASLPEPATARRGRSATMIRGHVVRARATAARLSQRIEVSEREGKLPALEEIRRRHALTERTFEALLLAGLGGHPRFGARLQAAARTRPPEELPLAAWIEALDRAAFG